jgi:hypothetical protein
MGFRMKKSIPLSNEDQQLIYSRSLHYKQMAAELREKVEELCRDCGGEYSDALFEFMTKNRGKAYIVDKYHIGKINEFYDCVEKFYKAFFKKIGY